MSALSASTSPRGAQHDPDGTADGRVPWPARLRAELLQLPFGDPTHDSLLRHVPQQPNPEGEARLLEAVARHRPTTTRVANSWALTTPLAHALLRGDAPAAASAALELRSRTDLAGVHSVLSACLDVVARDGAEKRRDVLDVHTTTACVRVVLAALQPAAPASWEELVVLAPAPGDQHTLGLHAIGQQLREAGHSTLVVDHPSVDGLAELAAHEAVRALVLSAHLTLPVGKARRLVTTLRQARPDVLLAAGGPGFPATMRAHVDLVTEDVADLVSALAARSNPLTEREQEVLLLVADGRTNVEIAEALHISPATVKTHLDHVFTKTGSVHRSAAVARALRQGWIR